VIVCYTFMVVIFILLAIMLLYKLNNYQIKGMFSLLNLILLILLIIIGTLIRIVLSHAN